MVSLGIADLRGGVELTKVPIPFGCDVWRSDNELRLFFLGKALNASLEFSPIVIKLLKVLCALPGLERGSSSDVLADPGRSREPGREGSGLRTSLSVDLDRDRNAFDKLDGWESSPDAFLLKLRHIWPTLDSDSLLLFSRVKVPKPSLLRSDEPLELQDP